MEQDERIMLIVTMGLILFGSITYYMEKRKEYKKQFSYLKYIFGVVKCKNN